MADVILMPRLSDTMTEGVIAAWHKNVGDKVIKGDVLAEVETDKATMELESYKEGILLYQGAANGIKIQVNDLLAIIGNEGEDISNLVSTTAVKVNHTIENKNEPSEALKPNINTSKLVDISTIDEAVLMPRLSDTMEVGVIANWYKQVGDEVKKGEILLDIETDKATMELESYKNGQLLYQGAQTGEKIAVNSLLCIIGNKNNVDVDAILQAVQNNSFEKIEKNSDDNEQNKTSLLNAIATVDLKKESRIKASPLAKKLAGEKGLDLKNIQGSGDGGRITKADIDLIKNLEPLVVEAKQTHDIAHTIPVFIGQEGYTDINNSPMRNSIARRLSESKFSAPHFYLKMEVNMDNAIAAREKLNENSEVKISFNDFIVKAVGLSLKKHPAVNSSWMNDKIRRYHHVHIGVAVAIDEGLIVPVIKFANEKTLSQISTETKDFAARARAKKLQPNEFTGNTFTISNLGMMDVDEFTAIINPPDSCILAVGKIREVVVKATEGFTVNHVMTLTLSCDHRSVDGLTGATFLQTVKKYLQNPVTMLL